MSVLTVNSLCKTYPAFALRSVSFSLEKGKITGFIGRNGAGKTTTLKSLFNIVHPDSGEVEFFGLPFAGNENAAKQRTGFVLGSIDYYAGKRIKRPSPPSPRPFIQAGTMPPMRATWRCLAWTRARPRRSCRPGCG